MARCGIYGGNASGLYQSLGYFQLKVLKYTRVTITNDAIPRISELSHWFSKRIHTPDVTIGSLNLLTHSFTPGGFKRCKAGAENILDARTHNLLCFIKLFILSLRGSNSHQHGDA